MTELINLLNVLQRNSHQNTNMFETNTFSRMQPASPSHTQIFQNFQEVFLDHIDHLIVSLI